MVFCTVCQSESTTSLISITAVASFTDDTLHIASPPRDANEIKQLPVQIRQDNQGQVLKQSCKACRRDLDILISARIFADSCNVTDGVFFFSGEAQKEHSVLQVIMCSCIWQEKAKTVALPETQFSGKLLRTTIVVVHLISSTDIWI